MNCCNKCAAIPDFSGIAMQNVPDFAKNDLTCGIS